MSIFYYDAQATGANNGLTKTDAFQTFAAATIAAGAGDTILVSHTSNEVVAGVSLGCLGQIAISIDFSDDSYKPGAIIDSRPSQDISFVGGSQGGFNSFGIDYAVGDDLRALVAPVYLEDCTITLSGFGDKVDLLSAGIFNFRNVTLVFGNVGAIIEYSGGDLYWFGGNISGGVTNLLAALGTVKGIMEFEGVDLLSADNLCQVLGKVPTKSIFRGCILKSGFTLLTGTLGRGALIALYGSYSSNIPYFFQEEHYEGGVLTETTNVKTDGSSDGVTPISIKMITNVKANKYNLLRMSLPIKFYVEPGVQTFNVDVMTDGITLKDDEAGIEITYPDSTIKRSISNSSPANPIDIPVDLPLSAAVWDTTGIITPVRQTISVSVDIKQAGWVEAHIYFAKPSEVMYADLKLLDGQRQWLAGQAYINGEAALVDYPLESDVREGTDYDSGNLTGILNLPNILDVRQGTLFDSDTKQGLLNLPGILDVRDSILFDNGTKEGELDLPSEDDVRQGILFDNLNQEGNLLLPGVADVRGGVTYGTDGIEFKGELNPPSITGGFDEPITIERELAPGNYAEGNYVKGATETIETRASVQPLSGVNGGRDLLLLAESDRINEVIKIILSTEVIERDIITVTRTGKKYMVKRLYDWNRYVFNHWQALCVIDKG